MYIYILCLVGVQPPLLTRLFQDYCLSVIPDKHRNKLMWQSNVAKTNFL